MPMSMTGFGSSTEVFRGARGILEIGVEIRTVNSKYLDISVRSPRCYMPLDSEIQKVVRKYLKRGRADVNFSLRVLEGKSRDISINKEQLKILYATLSEARESIGLKSELSMDDLLHFPDWLESKDAKVDAKEEFPFLEKVLEAALKEVVSARAKEGKNLTEVIENHRDKFGETLEKIGRQHETLLENLRKRTKDRVKSLYGAEGFDPHRLEQEVVLWISRADFQEEMDRIRHHLETFDKLVDDEQEVGRKLEFLVQELHRETNTLGSKCPEAQVTPMIIELKTAVERIREQIQNIE